MTSFTIITEGGEQHEAEDSLEVATILQAMDNLGKLTHGEELTVQADTSSTDAEVAEAVGLDPQMEEMESLDESTDEDWPDPGDIMFDPEHDPQYGDGLVEVIEMANDDAAGYHMENGKTVYEDNTMYPKDDPVVLAEYVDGSSKPYAFPLSRLEKASKTLK